MAKNPLLDPIVDEEPVVKEPKPPPTDDPEDSGDSGDGGDTSSATPSWWNPAAEELPNTVDRDRTLWEDARFANEHNLQMAADAQRSRDTRASYESAWSPRYSFMPAGGGGGMIGSIQSPQRHGWGNYEWAIPPEGSNPFTPRDPGAVAHAQQVNLAPWEPTPGLPTGRGGAIYYDFGNRPEPLYYENELYKPWYEPFYTPRNPFEEIR